MFVDQAHNLLAAKFWPFISVSLYFLVGSWIILLTLSRIFWSIYYPLKAFTLSKNLSGWFIACWHFFQTLSSASFSLIFYPNNDKTTLAVNTTPVGGLPKFFIYVICGFPKQFTAAFALYKAGSASASATLHYSANFSASVFWILVFSYSSFAFCCSI
jgi:hypothetical protein